ncbi:MAG: hypothetical protein SV377_08300 [Halobacteria archaeon]|nr:hypothetical protein [Halobacteria archaeon]
MGEEILTEEDPFNRYSGYETGDGNVVIYDTEIATAWVKSTSAVLLKDNR